ncbi:MAG: N-acetylmuramoyl-L-alanine amidase [Armatimonadetes bacterium]|nr:N-acetylmuramoyl-L-alanine amidase [Armatimonadota bacterium]
MAPLFVATLLAATLGGQVIETVDPDTRLRAGPGEEYDRVCVLPAGVPLWATDKQDQWYHVALGATLDAWVYQGTVRATGLTTRPANARLTDVTAGPTASGTRVAFTLTRPVPFRILPQLYPPALIVDLFDSASGTYWVRQKAQDRVCRGLALWMESSGWVRGRIDLAMPAIVGYMASYANGKTLALDIRRGFDAPGLSGKTICLDPGHGGRDRGAAGPNGLQEKAVNLAIAVKAAELLRAAGARVVLTRSTDTQVGPPGCKESEELEARVQVAIKANADLFVSIHNNHAGGGADSSVAGTEAYWWAPFCQPLAKALLGGVSAALGLSARHIACRPFHVLRSTDCPRALVECGYLSNPAEAEYMSRPEFAERAAEGVVAGMRRYIDWAAGVGPPP